MKNWRFLICAFILALLCACNPLKVTDPRDPRFNPNNFSFSDYDKTEVRSVFMVLFPVGTSQEFIDKVLVEAGGASKNLNSNYSELVHYIHKPYLQVNHTFIFKEGKLINIHPFGGAKVYEDQPGIEDIKATYRKEHNR